MRDIVLKDLVKTEGLEIKEGSVAVLVGGKNVTSNLDISYENDGTGFTIKTPYNLKNSDIPCIGITPYKDMDHWTDKQETKAAVDNLIRDTLWAELPECYDEISISEYRQRIYEYVYTRYRMAA